MSWNRGCRGVKHGADRIGDLRPHLAGSKKNSGLMG